MGRSQLRMCRRVEYFCSKRAIVFDVVTALSPCEMFPSLLRHRAISTATMCRAAPLISLLSAVRCAAPTSFVVPTVTTRALTCSAGASAVGHPRLQQVMETSRICSNVSIGFSASSPMRGISTKRRRNAAMNRHKLQKLRKRMRKLTAKNVKGN